MLEGIQKLILVLDSCLELQSGCAPSNATVGCELRYKANTPKHMHEATLFH